MDAAFYGFAVLLFAGVILLVEGSYIWWTGSHGKEARRIARRLRVMSGGVGGDNERVSILKQRRYSVNAWLDGFLHRRFIAVALDRQLIQSGLTWSVSGLLGATFGIFFAVLILLQSRSLPLLIQIAIALVCAGAPLICVRRARTARLIKIEEQLPEAADFLARAMRAGHSFTNVLQMVGTELPEPLSGEFRMAYQEMNYGVPLNEALYNLADRIPLTDLRYLVIAVVIQRESGGNLAEILSSIGYIIRQRLKLVGTVRVLSAEGRMSAWVLGCLPFAVLAVMMMLNPDYASLLWNDPIGVSMIKFSAIMMVLGVLWIRRVIHIRI